MMGVIKMNNLAAKLMENRAYSQHQATPSALYTSTDWLITPINRPRLHIGLWPIQSHSLSPELGLGLSLILAYLLERWPTITVYRLCAHVTDEPTEYKWSSADSQFSVDDWELDGLDENVAIWGSLEQSGEGIYELHLDVESDLAEEQEVLHSEDSEATSLAELLAKLPQIAVSIAAYLTAGDDDSIIPCYGASQWDEGDLIKALEATFHWELRIYLSTWVQKWNVDQSVADYEELLAVCSTLRMGLGDWIAGNAVGRFLSPQCSPWNESLLAQFEKSPKSAMTGSIYAIITALAFYRIGYPERAYDLLERDLERDSDNFAVWLVLAELYWQGGELESAIDTFQRAIEVGATSANLYDRYAKLLLVLDTNNVILGTRRRSVDSQTHIEGFVLIDTVDVNGNYLIHEAIAAYRAALGLEPDNAKLLSQLLIQLIDLQTDVDWKEFAVLVELDEQGEYIRNVIDAMHGLDSLAPGIEILVKHVSDHANSASAYLNLATMYLWDEQNASAKQSLLKARSLTTDQEVNSDIERLLLAAELPDFESRLGEITDLINAGAEIRSDQAEFLEETLERAPLFKEGYILLANAYLKWGEAADALEILLNGQATLPDNPEIAASLSQVLWDMGEEQLAFDCLNKALLKNPNHVMLLALIGWFLFIDEQEEEAKIFLARAETLDPRHSMLNQVRIRIANMISG
jgi:tetratricopeptide (TPR) repeat protein